MASTEFLKKMESILESIKQAETMNSDPKIAALLAAAMENVEDILDICL